MRPATRIYPFEQVADAIKSAIYDGRHPRGKPLPSENELAEAYGFGRSTIRRALDILSDEGLIDRHQGKQATVRQVPPVRIHGDGADWQRHREAGRPGFDGTVAEQGLTPRQEILEVADTTPAPTAIAVALGLEPGAPVVMRLVRQHADDVPVRLVASFYPAEWASGTRLGERKLIRGGAAAYIEDHLGRRLADSEVELEGRNPSRAERDLLNLPTGVTVIDVFRTFFDDQGDPVFVQTELADASRNRYRFRVSL